MEKKMLTWYLDGKRLSKAECLEKNKKIIENSIISQLKILKNIQFFLFSMKTIFWSRSISIGPSLFKLL